MNILEIVKPVETVEVVIDPDAAGEETALVEEGQLIAVERSGLSDETSEQVTRWAAALEGYRKEQVRLGIPYGEDGKAFKHFFLLNVSNLVENLKPTLIC